MALTWADQIRWIAAVSVVVCLLICAGCSRDGEKAVSPRPSQSASAANGYVGSEKCGTCHPRNYHEWKGSKHANMMSEASSKTVVGDFSCAPGSPGQTFPDGVAMTCEAGAYGVALDGSEIGKGKFAVAFTLGGTVRQMYLAIDAKGVPRVLPVQWNVQEGRWVQAVGDTGPVPGKGLRDWLEDCAGCHVTGFTGDTSQGLRGAWTENGIGCEACHGPGARHANAPTPEKPDTIFNPGNFHDELRADMVCGRCHTRGRNADGVHAYATAYEPGADYRPRFHEVSRGSQEFFWPDGSSRANHQQFIDFKTSKMFAKGVRCWACHNPHKSSSNRGADLRLSGNSLCRSCHVREPGPRNLTHAIHDDGSCVGCHMPPTAMSAVAGDVASHSFIPIRPEATLILGGGDVAIQPNSCNLCHYHSKHPVKDLDAFLQNRMKAQYGRPLREPVASRRE